MVTPFQNMLYCYNYHLAENSPAHLTEQHCHNGAFMTVLLMMQIQTCTDAHTISAVGSSACVYGPRVTSCAYCAELNQERHSLHLFCPWAFLTLPAYVHMHCFLSTWSYVASKLQHSNVVKVINVLHNALPPYYPLSCWSSWFNILSSLCSPSELYINEHDWSTSITFLCHNEDLEIGWHRIISQSFLWHFPASH